MKLLGLNSPEIFIILIVLLSILGPQRIEKGFLLFKKLVKFLLSKEKTIETEVKTEEPEKNEVKKETIETEVKSIKPKKSKVKEEIIDAEIKSIKPKKNQVIDEITDLDVNSDNK